MNLLLRCGGTGVVDNVARIILPEGRNASAVALTRLLFFKIILNFSQFLNQHSCKGCRVTKTVDSQDRNFVRLLVSIGTVSLIVISCIVTGRSKEILNLPMDFKQSGSGSLS